MKNINSSKVLTKSRMQTRRITKKDLVRLAQSSELRRIANDLGDLVTYDVETQKSNFGLECLSYRDKFAWIIARDKVLEKDAKLVIYHVDVTRLDFYLDRLKEYEGELSKRVEKELRSRPKKDGEIPDGISQSFIGADFEVKDFRELPGFITLHKRIYMP